MSDCENFPNEIPDSDGTGIEEDGLSCKNCGSATDLAQFMIGANFPTSTLDSFIELSEVMSELSSDLLEFSGLSVDDLIAQARNSIPNMDLPTIPSIGEIVNCPIATDLVFSNVDGLESIDIKTKLSEQGRKALNEVAKQGINSVSESTVGSLVNMQDAIDDIGKSIGLGDSEKLSNYKNMVSKVKAKCNDIGLDLEASLAKFSSFQMPNIIPSALQDSADELRDANECMSNQINITEDDLIEEVA